MFTLSELIDFREPVAILLVAMLHFIRDREDPYGIVDTLTSAMAPGSYLIISHATNDHVSPEEHKAGVAVYEQASAPIVPRSHAQILRFFDGLELVSRAWSMVPGGVGLLLTAVAA